MQMQAQIRAGIKWASIVLVGGIVATGHAQEPADSSAVLGGTNGSQSLTLFEDVEAATNRGRATSRPSRESRATTAEPEFTLVGVSRIGNKYSALLQGRDGESFIVKADPGSTTSIPGHSGYDIVDVSAGSVSIRYPGNNACIEFSDRGVTCSSAANIAQLVLANGTPIARRNPAGSASPDDSPVDLSEDVIEAQVNPDNPFEALRNGRRADAVNGGGTATSTNGARFTPRRISPEDVPEGKRVVATPFGDRLVDI